MLAGDGLLRHVEHAVAGAHPLKPGRKIFRRLVVHLEGQHGDLIALQLISHRIVELGPEDVAPALERAASEPMTGREQSPRHEVRRLLRCEMAQDGGAGRRDAFAVDPVVDHNHAGQQ